MAIQTRTNAARTADPVIATVGEFNGTPMLVVGPKGAHPGNKVNHNASQAKWTRLFTLDEEGDSNLFNVMQFVLEDKDVFETRAVVDAMERLVEQYVEARNELLEKAGYDVPQD